MKERILTVGLPVLANPFAWLAMESLCRQDTSYKWELIVFEDSHDANGKEFYEKYSSRMINCERIVYMYSEERISLSYKWRKMRALMSDVSIGLML